MKGYALKRVLRILLLNSTLLFPEVVLSQSTLKLTTENWPPFVITNAFQIDGNAKDASQLPGFSIEIANHAIEEVGLTVHYDFQPFKRQIAETLRGHYDAMLVLLESDAPDLVYPQEGVGLIRNCFFVHKETIWEYNDITSLEGIELGVVSGYTYGVVDEYIASNLNGSVIAYDDDSDELLPHLVNLLERGRLTAVLEDENVMKAYLSSVEKQPDFFVAGCLEGDLAKIGFSPANLNAQALANAFDRQIKKMRDSGELKAILDQYNVSDWAELSND